MPKMFKILLQGFNSKKYDNIPFKTIINVQKNQNHYLKKNCN